MTALLAQVQPADFGGWVANAFYVVGLVTALVVLWQRLRPQPPRQTTIEGQPVVVRPDAEYAPLYLHRELATRVDGLAGEIRESFDRLDAKRSRDVGGLHKDLEAGLNGVRKDIKDDVAGIHRRVDDVLRAVSKVQGRLDATDRHS